MTTPRAMRLLRRVIIESPYAAADLAERQRNDAYALRALHHSLCQGEAPLASHLLYTWVLDDDHPAERRLGISAGHAWVEVADAVVVYTDLGISSGMLQGINAAMKNKIPVEYRMLGGDHG